MDGMVGMVAWGPQDPRALLDHQEHQEILDHQEHQEIQEHQEYQVLLVAKKEQEVHRDQRENLDLRDKRDKQGRGCLESVTCAGAGQVVMEMLRSCTQVSWGVVAIVTKEEEEIIYACQTNPNMENTPIILKARGLYMALSLK